jgi:hypothetical protein
MSRKLYLREIQKSRLLSAGEERELAAKVNSGDQAAVVLKISYTQFGDVYNY